MKTNEAIECYEDISAICNPVASFIFSIIGFIFVRMKFLFFILSCLMLCLSCIPCSDGVECDSKEVLSISAVANHEQHSHDTEESCTPFCTCSCCAISIFYTPFAKAIFNKAVFQLVQYPTYNVAFNAEVYYSIWQPPKLS